ncbi:MAG TPA: hypothetical protein VFC29_24860 [Candidatus Limnocylindrales bacterium]|jgi:ATP-binding cassette subfamily F protein uup|nr:hypothetical protein [Candidatus Limnocylindrales bacterium]
MATSFRSGLLRSKARIDKAQHLIGELADLTARTRTASAGIDFSATDRKTRRLVELDHVTFDIASYSELRVGASD